MRHLKALLLMALLALGPVPALAQQVSAPPVSLRSGTWTPALSFATPGTSSFAYTTQAGDYQCVNGWVFADGFFNVNITAGTSSGNLRITLPNSYTINTTNRVAGSVANITSSNLSSNIAYWIASDTTASLIIQAGPVAAGSGLGPSSMFGATTFAFTITFKNASGTC